MLLLRRQMSDDQSQSGVELTYFGSFSTCSIMSDNYSTRIVDFIVKLPHMARERQPSGWSARRLTDGTLYGIPADAEKRDEGFLTVEWGGNPVARSEVRGETIAALEIAEGVRRWIETGQYTDYKAEYTHLAAHFEVKTGGTIACKFDPEAERTRELLRIAGRIGIKAALAALGKLA